MKVNKKDVAEPVLSILYVGTFGDEGFIVFT